MTYNEFLYMKRMAEYYESQRVKRFDINDYRGAYFDEEDTVEKIDYNKLLEIEE